MSTIVRDVAGSSATRPRAAEAAPAPAPRRIGSSDLHVFPLALGGNVFGWRSDARTTSRILDRFVERGGTLVDTADSYAGGRSEIMIGSWLRDRRAYDDVRIATKVGKSPDAPGVSGRAIRAAVEQSLRRLGVERIDLLFLHVDDPAVPFEETLLAVDELIAHGKVAWFGASQHAPERLLEARIASAQVGVAPMVAVQNRYNLLHRGEYESAIAPAAAAQGLGVLPRFALAGGLLTGKYRSRADIEAHVRERARGLSHRAQRVVRALDRVAHDHGSSLAAVAIAWLLAQPHVVAPVASATDPEQVAELMSAPALRLDEEHLALLDRASGGPFSPRRRPEPR